jgi:hypothetical protein
MIYKFFKDKHGNWGIWQWPNAPLWTWIVSWALIRILPYGQLGFAASLVSFGALFTWAWLEIFQGISYFRRTLGAVVMIVTIMSRLK